MSNFAFLETQSAYASFAPACVEAEGIFGASPALCAVGCRKALELAVNWVYAADATLRMPYRDNLQALLHEPSFRFSVDARTWGKLPYLVKLGNVAVHTQRSVSAGDALAALQALFEFVQWLDYSYGEAYEARTFDPARIPAERHAVDAAKLREQAGRLGEQEAEIKALRAEVAQLSARVTALKDAHRRERRFTPEELTEFETRKRFIDVDLKGMGWRFEGPGADVREEFEVEGMAGVPGQKGFCDYVLFGKDGLPLAVVEAKRTSKDPNIGRKQAALYADCLERAFGRRPMMFTTNGFETYFWDDRSGPQRQVSGVFGREDLQKLMNRRTERCALEAVPISDRITDRYYQKEAIRAVCGQMAQGFRRHLLVMATGTGKTRTAASLTDVLSRGGWVTNVLFLADRTALVKQARDAFKNMLPEMSLCNLCANRDDRNARIVFSTYPTMLNAIDGARTEDGLPCFTPAHFDLIIIDESHRSIFRKYRAIFDYFDAQLVGLTATPKTDVDRNTYDFFEMERGVPTYAYDYETAVRVDHVLVPYYNYEVKTQFLEEGIVYDKLSEADKERYEEDFGEDGGMPEAIPSAALNAFVFNKDTVDTVLQDVMERGIKVAGGDRLGKTILFAQNKRHAEFILERFNSLYPKLCGTFAQRVVCDDAYAQTIIEDFGQAEKAPHIAVSVDMLDTGIDVPECVNLVFFKKVRSKTKFWQMVGRGTRLCKGLACVDALDGAYVGKRRFLIFDYCGNFEFFRAHKEGYEGSEPQSLSEKIFGKRVRLLLALQGSAFADAAHQAWRKELADRCHGQVAALNPELVSVRLQRSHVERFRERKAFDVLSEGDWGELVAYVAPLIPSDDADEAAKRFDNLMYGLMLGHIDGTPALQTAQTKVRRIAERLERKATIPQIRERLPLLQDLRSETFWKDADVLLFERVRKELRELVRFLDESGEGPGVIVTDLTDPVRRVSEGQPLEAAYDFADYRAKVNRYVNEHGDVPAIRKLTHNIPLSEADYRELERILTQELGTPEDYRQAFGDTPFGLLVRKIAKLDHKAAMEAFSAFINDGSLNQRQIAFVHQIISHIEKNGYMEDVTELIRPPFDRPVSFVKLFDAQRQAALLAAIRQVRENALRISAS